jgi:adenylate kinase family enzyme
LNEGRTQRFLVAIVGSPGSGKTTVAEHLVANGYAFYAVSDTRRTAALVQNVDPDDFAAMRKFTEEFYSERGRGIFVDYALRNIAARRVTPVVLEGLRNAESVTVVKNACAVHEWRSLCIGLKVDAELAFERVITRARKRDAKSPETVREYVTSAGGKADVALEFCDVVIPNNETIAALLAGVDGAIAQALKSEDRLQNREESR